MAISTPQPTRRSTRGQPLARQKSGGRDSDYLWLGEPVDERATNPNVDYANDEERQVWEDATEEEQSDAQTRFYKSFKAAGARRGGNDATVFNVGDTVLVDTAYREPSVAVITCMWETDIGRENDRKRIQLHWFLLPSQQPTIRPKRQHLEDEIYYSLSNTAVFSPQQIVGLCTVDGPRKPTSSPSKKRIRQQSFQCSFATNGLRGFFYKFSWPDHRKAAIAAKSYSDGSAEPWKIAVDEAEKAKGTPSRKRRATQPASTPSKKRRAAPSDDDEESATPPPRTPRKAKQRQAESPTPNRDDDDDFDPPPDDSSSSSGDEEARDSLFSASDDDEDDELPINKSPSKRRKRKLDDSDDEEEEEQYRTPRKKRKSKTIAKPTPHSKAALARRRRSKSNTKSPSKFSRAAPANYGAAFDAVKDMEPDPWLRAMHVLHVANRPDTLPCRDDEYQKILDNIEDLLEEGSGGCIYISGVPGTGKTATVHAVIRELKKRAEQSEINPFSYVEINGLKIPEPNAAYTLLWETLSGHDVVKDGRMKKSAKESLKELTRYFSNGQRRGPSEHACVVLMDELDQLLTTKQDVVYNFFNWPTMTGSKLVVIAVANTMDLPERAMTGRVKSRLGLTTVNFSPYAGPQLEEIVNGRLERSRIGLDDDAKVAIKPDAIKLAAMKVSGVSGDARRVLDICRRAVEIAKPLGRSATIADINKVVQVMQNSPAAAFLRECSFHERLMLASLIKCMKREGVEEIQWGEVQNQHLIYLNVLAGENDPSRKPTPSELRIVLQSLAASKAMLVEEGAAAMRKLETERRVLLNLEQGEVERVLGDIGGQRWKNVLNS